MPTRAPRVCRCGAIVNGRCPRCTAERQRASDQRRPSARERGYDARWQCESKAFLALPGNGRCACGCGRAAEMVDHRIAPKGDKTLFWDRSNWQAMTRECNSRKAVRTEGALARPQGHVENFGKGRTTNWGQPREGFSNSAHGRAAGR